MSVYLWTTLYNNELCLQVAFILTWNKCFKIRIGGKRFSFCCAFSLSPKLQSSCLCSCVHVQTWTNVDSLLSIYSRAKMNKRKLVDRKAKLSSHQNGCSWFYQSESGATTATGEFREIAWHVNVPRISEFVLVLDGTRFFRHSSYITILRLGHRKFGYAKTWPN